MAHKEFVAPDLCADPVADTQPIDSSLSADLLHTVAASRKERHGDRATTVSRICLSIGAARRPRRYKSIHRDGQFETGIVPALDARDSPVAGRIHNETHLHARSSRSRAVNTFRTLGFY